MADKKINEMQVKHLELIQGIINRMNGNSFQIKTCNITILSILLAIYAVHSNEFIVFIATLPTMLFWCLDSYYLQQERKFRGLYNSIIGSREYVDVKPFEMPIEKLKGGQFSYWNVLWSRTIAWFYGMILTVIALIFALIRCT